jgi:hypothetical protein
MTVVGSGFFVGCNDTSVNGQAPPPMPPDHGVRIELRQGNRSFALATVDADSSYAFSTSVTIPAAAAVGRASIVAVGANGAPSHAVTIVAGTARLARTGAGVLALALIGLAAIIAGVLLVTVASSASWPRPS